MYTLSYYKHILKLAPTASLYLRYYSLVVSNLGNPRHSCNISESRAYTITTCIIGGERDTEGHRGSMSRGGRKLLLLLKRDTQ